MDEPSGLAQPAPQFPGTTPPNDAGGDSALPSRTIVFSPPPDISFHEAQTARQPDAPPLFSMGPYEVLRELARGGMGIVYQARHVSLDRIVALKTIRPEFVNHADTLQRFDREMRAAARLQHPNIVPVYDVGSHEGKPFYTMAYLSGGNLAEHGVRLRADLPAALLLMEAIARAVHHAHQCDIVHRDLKPSNVLLDERGQPQVSDFGLAKFRGADADLTRTGMVMGTPAYMAPEQAAGRLHEVGPASDVWALGVMLLELLAGRRPFVGSAEEIQQQLLLDDPPALRTFRPDLDSRFEAVLGKCLAKAPRDRLSAEALADDLARLVRAPAPPGDCTPLQPTRSPRRRRRLIQVAALLILLVGLPLLGLRLFPGPGTDDPDPPATRQPDQVLIPVSGPPAQGQFLCGEQQTVAVRNPQAPFSLRTGQFALWELLRQPPRKPYRFEVEARLENSADGEVGLFVGHRELAGEHYFWRLGFSETGRAPGRVSLALRNFTPPDDFSSLALGNPETAFAPSSQTGNPPEFHALRIDVHDDRLVAFWHGQTFGAVTAAQFDSSNPARFFHLPRPEFEFCSPTSLGIYVKEGKGSFRNAVVRPIP